MEIGKPLKTVIVEPITKPKEKASPERPLPITPRR